MGATAIRADAVQCRTLDGQTAHNVVSYAEGTNKFIGNNNVIQNSISVNCTTNSYHVTGNNNLIIG